MKQISNQYIEANSMDLILEIAHKVVSRYVKSSGVPIREKEDVVMAIVEKFLNQQIKINHAFEGKSKITTYYIAVLNRMCCEIIRKESKHWYAVTEGDKELGKENHSTLSTEAEKELIIKDEVKLLANTMLFFNDERNKVNLFLKIYFNLPIKIEDIVEYSNDKAGVLKDIIESNKSMSKGDIFESLARIVNLVEGKDVKGDAVRMWLNKQIDTILSRLNQNGVSNHSKESLEILLEMKDSYNSKIIIA